MIFAILHTAYMLAGGTEPLAIWDQHEWRPQAGGVVSTVAQVAQQNLRQQIKPAVMWNVAGDSLNHDIVLFPLVPVFWLQEGAWVDRSPQD